jgi:hypothetical protein
LGRGSECGGLTAVGEVICLCWASIVGPPPRNGKGLKEHGVCADSAPWLTHAPHAPRAARATRPWTSGCSSACGSSPSQAARPAPSMVKVRCTRLPLVMAVRGRMMQAGNIKA